MCHTIITRERAEKRRYHIDKSAQKTCHFLRTISNYRKGDEVIRLWHSLLYHKINHQLMKRQWAWVWVRWQEKRRVHVCVRQKATWCMCLNWKKTHSNILHKEDNIIGYKKSIGLLWFCWCCCLRWIFVECGEWCEWCAVAWDYYRMPLIITFKCSANHVYEQLN